MKKKFAIILVLVIIAIVFLFASVIIPHRVSSKIDPDYMPDLLINHEDIGQIVSFLERNPDVSKKIQKVSVVFVHASVGENIIGGMKRLNRRESELFSLQVVSSSESDAGGSAAFYEVNRGNPGALKKLSSFEEMMSSGLANKANIAINKLCYIDIPKYDGALTPEENAAAAEAFAAKYLESMSKLAAEYPNVSFVYSTMPLTCKFPELNYMRKAYNDKIRSATAGKFFLYDIADIECSAPDGKACTVPFGQENAQAVETMYKAYSFDGGHLNRRGSERAALAMYALIIAYIS